MADAIVMRGVTKRFGEKVAVRDLDLEIPAGSLCGLIGPNGAGKTTSIRMVMSILFPDRGELSVLGRASALEAKERIGYLPEERGLYRKMRVGAFLTYMARLKGVPAQEIPQKVRSWLEKVGLSGVERMRCEELSKGMQQKVQFIASVIHQPDLLILDEPFSGLDPVNMRLLREIIEEEHQRGATIVFSTHVMVQAEQLCERIVMIHDGVKVLDAPLQVIRAQHDPRSIYLEPLHEASPETLRSLPGIAEAVPRKPGWQLVLSGDLDAADAIPLITRQVPVARIEVLRPSLEDVFVEIVRGAAGASPEELERVRAEVRGDPASAGASRP